MQAENWKTIKETLLEALKLGPSGRRDYLESAGISAEVRAEVESLLAQENSAHDFMSLTASGFTREFFDGTGPTASSLINQNIGIYEIVSELGCGGMGVVYLAMRRDGKFEQRVAIKMLKREFNTEKIRQTFTREKEILATLSHSNIATLLDAGTTDDGIPYLVMEYIEGEPIDEFCQGRKLSLNHRLKLFNKVCDTVALAHRSLIVHRDLKPSNILVTKDGEPKLLDFGISKLLDTDPEDAAAITHLGAMTPLYASPEQIKGEPVTTATDVYSLGVVLFKMLTGSLQLAHFNMDADKLDLNESQLAEAESLILEAKTLFNRHYGESHTATFSVDGSLAKLALTRGDLNLAEKLWDANARRYKQASNERYAYLWAVYYLAKVKLELGKITEAEVLFEQALEGGRQEWGVKDPRFEHLHKEITQARAAVSRQ